MQINLESFEKHSIQAYGKHVIQINSATYEKNIIVSRDTIITDWPIRNIKDLNEKNLDVFLNLIPEIIIIGHNDLGKFIKPELKQILSNQHIGLESMSVDAACRTFNILLNESRAVSLGIIW